MLFLIDVGNALQKRPREWKKLLTKMYENGHAIMSVGEDNTDDVEAFLLELKSSATDQALNKNQPDFYLCLATLLQKNANEMCLIDLEKINVKAAKKAGLVQSFQYSDFAATEKKLIKDRYIK